MDDITLLRKYAERGSEEAFSLLVARHINKVYSVALRHTRNPHHAEEITQAVFVILAKKSRRWGKNVVLSGWLYQTARLTAMTFIRGEIRRARREQEAYMQISCQKTENATAKEGKITGYSEFFESAQKQSTSEWIDTHATTASKEGGKDERRRYCTEFAGGSNRRPIRVNPTKSGLK